MRAFFCPLAFVLLALVSLSAAQAPNTVPGLFLIKIPQTYKEARKICQDRGARLLMISRPEDNANHYEKLQRFNISRAWIGLNRRKDTVDVKPYNFRFEDHKNAVPSEQFWGPGEPNNYLNHKERCVEVRVLAKNTPTKNWNDRPCDDLNPFYCQVLPL